MAASPASCRPPICISKEIVYKRSTSVDSKTASAARVDTSPLVIGISSTVRTHGVGTSGTLLLRLLLVLSLVLLDLLGLALALLVELLVLSLDLSIAVLGLAAAASSTVVR